MVTKVATSHEISGINNPVTHGTARFDLNPTSLSAAVNVASVLKLSDVPAGVAVIIEDAWIEVTAAFDAGTKFGLGDATYDNSFLTLQDVSSTGIKGKEASDKGVSLADTTTAFVDASLNLVISATTAIPQQVSTGAAILYVAYKEIENASHTESDIGAVISSVGDGTIPNPGGAAYSFTASDGTNSATIDSGETLQITGNNVTFNSGTQVFTITGSAAVDSDYWSATYNEATLSVDSSGVITGVKSSYIDMPEGASNSPDTHDAILKFDLSTESSNAIAAHVMYQNTYRRDVNTKKLVDYLRPVADLPAGHPGNVTAANPFYPTYVILLPAGSSGPTSIPTLVLPDPSSYAPGTSFRVYYPVNALPDGPGEMERQLSYKEPVEVNHTHSNSGNNGQEVYSPSSGSNYASSYIIRNKSDYTSFHRRLIKISVNIAPGAGLAAATGTNQGDYTDGLIANSSDLNGSIVYKGNSIPSELKVRSFYINGDYVNYGSRTDVNGSYYTYGINSHFYMAPGDVVSFTRSPAIMGDISVDSGVPVWQATSRFSSYPDYIVNNGVFKDVFNSDTLRTLA